MKVKDLSPQLFTRIKKMRYDNFIEKHEGPETWKWQILNSESKEETEEGYLDAEFMKIENYNVLLPIGAEHHPNIKILHHFLSKDETKMVIYLKDTTYRDDDIWAGFVAIFDRFPNESFYIATFYHEWFITDYDPLANKFKF